MNPRKPYRCSKCKQVGHQSRSCHASPTTFQSLEGAMALRALVPESYGVWIVVTGSGRDALLQAFKAEAERTNLGFAPSQSHSNAFQWLCDRAEELPPETVRRAKRAAATLERAQRAYAEAVLPIRIALGYAKPDTTVASDSTFVFSKQGPMFTEVEDEDLEEDAEESPVVSESAPRTSESSCPGCGPDASYCGRCGKGSVL